MQQIVEDYYVASGTTPASLRARVQEMLLDGWQPVGGIAATSDEGGRYFYQAMVLYQFVEEEQAPEG